MKRNLIEFVSLIVMLFLFNVLSYIVGILFVDDFETFVYSHIQVLDELLIIVFFVPFLLLAIRFYKKGGIIIFSIINISLGILILHNDIMGTGWEFVSSYVFLISKFNHLLSIIIDFDGWQKINVTVIWGCYIDLVGYSYVYVRKIINALLQGKGTDNSSQQEKNNRQ